MPPIAALLRGVFATYLIEDVISFSSLPQSSKLNSKTISEKSLWRPTSSLRAHDGPILEPEEGYLDSASIGMPVVHRYRREDKPSGESWVMWFQGRSTSFESELVPLSTGRVYVEACFNLFLAMSLLLFRLAALNQMMAFTGLDA